MKRNHAQEVVRNAQKRLRQQYGDGLNLLSDVVQKALLYQAVLSPSLLMDGLLESEISRESAARYCQELLAAINELF